MTNQKTSYIYSTYARSVTVNDINNYYFSRICKCFGRRDKDYFSILSTTKTNKQNANDDIYYVIVLM